MPMLLFLAGGGISNGESSELSLRKQSKRDIWLYPSVQRQCVTRLTFTLYLPVCAALQHHFVVGPATIPNVIVPGKEIKVVSLSFVLDTPSCFLQS